MPLEWAEVRPEGAGPGHSSAPESESGCHVQLWSPGEKQLQGYLLQYYGSEGVWASPEEDTGSPLSAPVQQQHSSHPLPCTSFLLHWMPITAHLEEVVTKLGKALEKPGKEGDRQRPEQEE